MQVEYRNNSKKKKQSPLTKTIKLTTLGLSIFSVTNGLLIYNNYHKSLNWSTNRDSLKMASMPIDTLNDSGEEVKHKEDFLVLAQQAMTPDGQIHLNTKSQKALLKSLNKIKTAKPLYKSKYDKIMDKYRIRQKLDSLYKNKNTLKKDSTPLKVQDTLDNIAPKLNEIYQKNNKDAFVASQLIRIHLLVQDINKIINISNQINQVVYVNHGTLQPHADLIPGKYERLVHQFMKLHYKWLYLDHYYSFDKELNELLVKQQDKLNKYKTYQDDLHARDKAYKDWEDKRKQRKHDYLKDQEEKRKQKEEEERQAQQQREEEAKEQAEIKRQEEQDKNDIKQANKDESQSSSDNSSSSSNSSNSSSSSSKDSSNSVSNSNPNSGMSSGPSRRQFPNNNNQSKNTQSSPSRQTGPARRPKTNETDDDSDLYAD